MTCTRTSVCLVVVAVAVAVAVVLAPVFAFVAAGDAILRLLTAVAAAVGAGDRAEGFGDALAADDSFILARDADVGAESAAAAMRWPSGWRCA